MEGKLEQSATGRGNIQAGRDIIVNIFRSRPHSTAANRVHARILYTLLIVLLLGTTLPHSLINIAASIGAVLMWLAWSITARRFARPGLLAITVFSVLSGCSGPLFADLEYPAIVFGQVRPAKMGAAQGFGICGFGLEAVTTDTAKQNGGLTKVLASQEIRGYGLISVARVQVYGE
jgi:hypothetical protein